MTKNELINLLTNIEGNPEILTWNSSVGDYHNIGDIISCSLVKPTLDEWTLRLVCERIRDTGDRNYKLSPEETEEWSQSLQSEDWELNQYVAEKDIKEGRYIEKQAYIISSLPRNIETFDRLGQIEY